MNEAQFPTTKLAEKYGIVKSVLYNRLNVTGTNGLPPSPNGGKKTLGESSTNGSKNGFSPNEPKNNGGGLSSP